jgi:hypothetical protein
MIAIPTWFANLVFLPGKMVHTAITKSFTQRYNLKIHSINYLEIAPDRSQIVYDSPDTLREKYTVGIAPFFILNSVALGLYYLALTADSTWLFLFFAYIGMSFSYASFPTIEITYALWKATIQGIRKGDVLSFLFLIPIGIISIIKFLSIFGIEILFALGLLVWLSIILNINPFDN